MKHRGPDSTGYALYGAADRGLRSCASSSPTPTRRATSSSTTACAQPRARSSGACARSARATHAIEERDRVRVRRARSPTTATSRRSPTASRTSRGAEVLSLGHSLRDRQGPRRRRDGRGATTASTASRARTRSATCRMATESDVDISGAHPYWAYPFSDIAVVHNGQLTNYHHWRRRLERSGHRFQSECDSEIIAVYLAERMAEGASLEDAMRQSLEELDGVFTYICVTEDALGHGQGRAGRQAARALRGRRPRRARLRGDRDPRGRRPRDRHVRPVRGRGDGVERYESRPTTRAASSSSTAPSRGIAEIDGDARDVRRARA